MIGFEAFGDASLGIDADFQSLAFLRKGVINPNDRFITCYIDEIIVVRAQDEMIITCQMVQRDNNQLKYSCFLEPTKGHNLSQRITSLNHRTTGSMDVEYFIFGKPKYLGAKYGIQVFNEKSELVFSSEQRYMHPAGMVSTTPDGDRTLGYENVNSHKLGIVLTSFPTYWLSNPREIVTAAISFGGWENGSRLFGIVPFPSYFSGGGGTSWLENDIESLVIDVSNL